jgi:hypothetical protein
MASLRATVARRYCDVHAAGHHICEMGQQAANTAAAACVEWLESNDVAALVGDDVHVLALLVKSIHEEDFHG